MSQDPPAQPIPYFSRIRLKHATGSYLASFPENFTHEGSSGQQMVGGVDAPDDNTIWIVRPPHRRDYSKTGNDQLQIGDAIRLQHWKTGLNLHSHTLKAPVTDQKEITAFGKDGLGNQDDDWVVAVRDGSPLETGKTLILKSVQTSLYLHSHNDRHFPGGHRELQEVTGFGSDDANNDWVITEVLPPPDELTKHPFVTIASSNFQKEFDTPDEFITWIDAERIELQWLSPNRQPGAHSRIYTVLDGFFNDLKTRTVECNRNASATTAFFNSCQSLDTLISEWYGRGRVLAPGDPRFEFIKNLRERDPVIATHAWAYLCNMDMEQNQFALKGTFLALCFEQGISDRAKAEAMAIEAARVEKEHAFEDVQKKIEGANESITAHIRRSADVIANQETQFKSLVETGQKELAAVKKAYDQEMSLKASVLYWKSKAMWNRIAAVVFGLTAAAIGIAVVMGLDRNASAILKGDAATPPHWWEVGTIVIMATFGIWAVRVFVQLMYSNAHLAADANERYTMLLTYLAMIRESVLPTAEDHKLLILQSLFRPGATGVIKDDGSPSTWLDFIANKLGGKS